MVFKNDVNSMVGLVYFVSPEYSKREDGLAPEDCFEDWLRQNSLGPFITPSKDDSLRYLFQSGIGVLSEISHDTVDVERGSNKYRRIVRVDHTPRGKGFPNELDWKFSELGYVPEETFDDKKFLEGAIVVVDL